MFINPHKITFVMKGIKRFLAAASTALFLNSCVTYVTNMDFKYAEECVSHVVEDDSDFGKLFLADEPVLFEDKKWAQKELETLVEHNYSLYLGKKVNFPKAQFKETGYNLIIVERGGLGVDQMKLLYNRDFSQEEKDALVYLGKRVGKDIDIKSDRFKELVGIFKEDKQEQLLEEFDKKNSIPEPEYSADMFEIGGYALDFLIYYYVRMDSDASSLYGTFFTMAHEYSHTMLYNEMDLGYGANFLFSYLNVIDNNDIVDIHETACDAMAERVTDLFIENSLVEGSELYEMAVKSRKFSLVYEKAVREIIATYESIPKSVREEQRDDVMEMLSDDFYEMTGYHKSFNEAKLSIMKRYSGNIEFREKLDKLLDTVGPNMFPELVPYMYHKEDIDILQKRADQGMGFFDIVAPIMKRECPINKGDLTF